MSTEQFMIYSDEVYFYLTLLINKQNNPYWGQSAQENGIEGPPHDNTFLVWCATSANRVFGLYVFGGTVKSTNYLKMLKYFVGPRFQRLEVIKNAISSKMGRVLTKWHWFKQG
jgi:meiotically up-regulated gene 157 (Mug157) protein